MAIFTDSFYQYKTFEKIDGCNENVHQRIFEECIFTNCDFSGCDFFKTRFADCFFIDCNMSMVKFRNTGLQNVSFRECKLLGIQFNESDDFLYAVRFESCVLDFSSFMGKKMTDVPFGFCSLKNAAFIKTNLKGSKFEHCDLQDAIFEESNLTETDFLTATNYIIDPAINDIRRARFSLDGLPGLLLKYDLHIE